MDNNTDLVKEYIAVVNRPLAELRRLSVAQISAIRDHIRDSSIMDGVCIGISPSDKTLQEYDRGEITDMIIRTIKRMRYRGSDGRLVPIAPLHLIIVGEYSPQHRWHYHGIIKVNNIVILDKIKKRLNQVIGRTVTEMIMNAERYDKYMFKQYIADENNYYVWSKEDCYGEFKREQGVI